MSDFSVTPSIGAGGSLADSLSGSRLLAGGNSLGEQRSFQEVLGMARGVSPDATPAEREREATEAAEKLIAATFVEPLLKSVRESSNAAAPFAPTHGEKQFRGLMDVRVAESVVARSEMGIVKRIAEDLLRAGGRVVSVLGRISPEVVCRLEPVLESLVSEHETLLALAREHRAALSQADPAALGAVVARTGECLARIAELEDERCRVIGFDPEHPHAKTAKPTITEIAALTGPDERARLTRLGDRLRDMIERVRDEHRTIQAASSSLADHMRGLMRQVSAKLSHAGTYSASGSVDPGRQQVISGIDVKS